MAKPKSPKSRPKFKAADQSTSALKALLNKGSAASRADVNKAIAELKKRGEDTPPPTLVSGGRREKGNDVLMNKGGKATKKVPVISIGVGMAEVKKGKAQMNKGGMANGKVHMYSSGGSVEDKMNPGLKALQKEAPEVVAKMLKK